jgi:two-component system aerobic respiration control sensor histidine kinase ArcB
VLLSKKKQDRIDFLEYVIAKMPGLVYCKDLNGVYLACNEAQAHIVGLSTPNDLVGKTDFDILDKEEANKLRVVDKQILSGTLTIDENHPKEVELILPNGQVAHFESVKIPLYDNNGKIMGLVGISKDVTDRKKAELVKNDFISNMEHDLRTPFSGIGGIANLLYSLYQEKYPELKKWLELMVTSCSQWENIHNRIFDVHSTKQPLKIEPFYIQDELERIQTIFAATLKIKKLDFFIHSPSREETGYIESDSLKFNLIMLSVIGNAINFTAKGSITIKVTRSKHNFTIDVIDTGIGIPKDKLDYIFEKFTKLSRSNQYGGAFKGMGLGLYISREDARKLKGDITVRSELNKGSVFTLTLPSK